MRLWIIFSRILLGTEKIEMGLNDDGVSLVIEDGFGIGTTLACFHDCGVVSRLVTNDFAVDIYIYIAHPAFWSCLTSP